MSIDFPASPTNGQSFTSGTTTWIFDGTKWTAASAGGTGGITQLIGDVTAGPGSGNQAATLANTAVTPGSYTSANVTVDAKGRLTAAASGAAAVTPHPGYRSGQYYTRPISAAGGNIALAANRIYLTPILIGAAITIDAVQIFVGSAVAGSADIGIYANAAGAPGSLIQDFGTVSTATPGPVIITGLSRALSPGWYWLAAGFSATPSVISSGAADVSQQHLIGIAALAGSYQGNQGWTATWAFSAGNLPTTLSAPIVSSASMPLIAFRVT